MAVIFVHGGHKTFLGMLGLRFSSPACDEAHLGTPGSAEPVGTRRRSAGARRPPGSGCMPPRLRYGPAPERAGPTLVGNGFLNTWEQCAQQHYPLRVDRVRASRSHSDGADKIEALADAMLAASSVEPDRTLARDLGEAADGLAEEMDDEGAIAVSALLPLIHHLERRAARETGTYRPCVIANPNPFRPVLLP